MCLYIACGASARARVRACMLVCWVWQADFDAAKTDGRFIDLASPCRTEEKLAQPSDAAVTEGFDDTMKHDLEATNQRLKDGQTRQSEDAMRDETGISVAAAEAQSSGRAGCNDHELAVAIRANELTQRARDLSKDQWIQHFLQGFRRKHPALSENRSIKILSQSWEAQVGGARRAADDGKKNKAKAATCDNRGSDGGSSSGSSVDGAIPIAVHLRYVSHMPNACLTHV